MERILLRTAQQTDYAAVVDLVNLAFRGSDASASWNVEVGIIEGQRLNYRDAPDGPLLGTVLLDPGKDGVWYLGLLTVRPDLQQRQLGRTLLAAAEDFARQRGAHRIRMTVVNVRDTLIAWYQRRSYALAGETKPFPYGDERFGRPLRDDLHFVVLQRDI